MSVEVRVGGIVRNVVQGTLRMDDAVEERSTPQFLLDDDLTAIDVRQGTPVEIREDTEVVFDGVVDRADAVPVLPDAGRRWAVTAKDWHYLADRRVLAASYENVTAGAIVLADIATILAEEGITVTAANVQDGPTIELAQFNYVAITRVLDALAERAGFTWWIDVNRVLHFVARGTEVAPWAIGWTDVDEPRPTLTHGNPAYRNRQYVRGGRDETDPQTERFHGDGETRTYPTAFPISKVPTVEVARWDQGMVVDTGNVGWAEAPHAAPLAITGDITLVAHVRPTAWTGAFQLLVGRSVSGSNRSYYLRLDSGGVLTLLWSNDGSALLSKSSTVAVPFTAGEEGWVAARLAVDNGASGHTVRFYTSTDGITWTQLGADVVTAGTTSIFAGTSPLTVGRVGSNTWQIAGKVYEARVYSGLHDPIAGTGGSVVANPRFGDTTEWPPGVGVVTDTTGNVWTLQNTAAVEGELGAFVEETVNIGGLNLETPRQWNWNGEQAKVDHDFSEDPLGPRDIVRVTYVGSFPIVAIGTDEAERVRVQTLEGVGSGLVEDVYDESQVKRSTEAFQIISSKLARFAREGSVLRFTTRRAGLKPGQLATVTLPELGLDATEMLITAVTTTDERATMLRRDVTAVAGPNLGSPLRFFEFLIRRGEPLVIRENLGEQEILVILAESDESMTLTEAFQVDVFACPTFPFNFPADLC